LGFINVGFKGDSVNLDQLSESDYFDANDPVIPKASKSGMSFDMGLGLYYTTGVWWIGASYSHLTQPRVEWDEFSEIKVRGTFFAAGGYNHRFKYHKEWQLKSSLMLMTDFASWDINATLLCEYKDRYRWGLGYRIAGSVNILLGVDIISGLTLGYTCELPHNKLLLESYGTHEIYLAYGFNILKPKRTNKYKSVRFL
jgi:type IX secretion system PorP/SprF family membrane protein